MAGCIAQHKFGFERENMKLQNQHKSGHINLLNPTVKLTKLN